MRAVLFDQDDKISRARWDNYIIDHEIPGYALYNWGDIYQDLYRRKILRIGLETEQGQLSGLCFGYFGSGRFYTSRYGFYANDKTCSDILMQEVNILCNKLNLHEGLFTSGHSRNFPADETILEKSNMLLPLFSEDGQSLWDLVPKKTKNIIRKAHKREFIFSQDWQKLLEFYDVYKMRQIQKNLNVFPLSFFQVLKETFKQRVVLMTALQENRVVAGMIFFLMPQISSYLFNASLESAQKDGVNNALMWEAMNDFKERGIKNIELGESRMGSPVYDFKRRLSQNVQNIPAYYWQKKFKNNMLPINLYLSLHSKALSLLGRNNPENNLGARII
jgi:hypothetical protein